MGSAPGLLPQDHHAQANAGLEFTYSSDFDTRGVLYYIGTEQYTQPWRNPCLSGGVSVRSSPLDGHLATLAAESVVGRETVRCVTAARKEAWFVIDLGERWVQPTAYTLRHYKSWDTEALREWKLQGSNDGKKWTKLLSHKKDLSLDKRGATKTWVIPTTMKAYRMFRVLQTGKNSNGHLFMALSGFELYGQLFSSPR
jgi:hypothetical protein